jgi:uncharacterized repeat protein (TIGR01451 family)
LRIASALSCKRALAAVALLFGLIAPAIGDAAVIRGRLVPAPPSAPASSTPSPQDDGLYRVLVKLKTGFTPEGGLTASAAALQRATIRSAQQRVLGRLNSQSHRVIAAYEIFPVIAMEVDAATLASLRNAPDVESIEEDVPMRPADADSNGTVHVAVPWSQGYDGTGWAVAILDTGFQTNHPFLAGKTIAEACFSTTNAGQKSVSLCPNGQSTSGTTPGQSGAGAAAHCDSAIDGCEHGSHVAGIAVGHDYPGGPGFDGIARGAKLIGIQVFSKFTADNKCGGPGTAPCVLTFTSDQLAALQYVYTTIRPAFPNIASVNMSIGGGTPSTTTCDTNTLKTAIDTLRSVNIATVISAGNDGATNAISSPGCISTAISVGATNNLDGIAGFSNRAPFMSLFAPGVGIKSSVPTGAFENLSGTSMAAPLVSGAWALLMQKTPGSTVAQVLSTLQTTGLPITIPGGAQIKRVRLGDAFGVPTLNVSVAKSFAPGSIAYAGTSTLTITLTNPNNVALTGTSFVDALPGGMTTSSTPGVTNTCGGTVVAAPVSVSVSLSGGTVPANGFLRHRRAGHRDRQRQHRQYDPGPWRHQHEQRRERGRRKRHAGAARLQQHGPGRRLRARRDRGAVDAEFDELRDAALPVDMRKRSANGELVRLVRRYDGSGDGKPGADAGHSRRPEDARALHVVGKRARSGGDLQGLHGRHADPVVDRRDQRRVPRTVDPRDDRCFELCRR